jgi:AcrR family transcriptional regulator
VTSYTDPVTRRPFHHGNLRAVLLDQAEIMLRSGGVEGLSLRELARQAGVSHGAPRSHFIDRQALLDALAERGFHRLADNTAAALKSADDLRERWRLAARAYIDFAVHDAALMDLMFATKMTDPTGPVYDASVRFFGLFDEALPSGVGGTYLGNDGRDRMKLVLAAMLQGTATLLAARRITQAQGERAVDDAIDMILGPAFRETASPKRG